MNNRRLAVTFSMVVFALVLMGAGCSNQPGLGQQTETISTQQEEINQLKTELADLKAKNSNEPPSTVAKPKNISAPPVNKNIATEASQQQEDAFKKKQVCNEYLDASITKAKSKEWPYLAGAKPGSGSMFTSNYEMFYSPKTNSCLFSYQENLLSDEGKFVWISYELQDALTGKVTEHTLDLFAGRSTSEDAKQSDVLKDYWNDVLLPSYY